MSKTYTLKYIFILLVGTFFSAFSSSAQSSSIDCSTAAGQQMTVGTCATITANQTLGSPALSGCSTATSAEDGWVWFTAVSTSSTVSYTPTTAGRDVAIYIYATCGTATYLACANDFGSGTSTESITLTTVGGTQYRVRIVRVNGTAGNTSGTLCIKKAEDECSGAIALNAASDNTCTTVSGSTANATQSQVACSGTADDDVWYKFVATATSHQVTVTRTSLANPVFEVFSGTCGSLTQVTNGCVNDFNNNTAEARNFGGLVIGDTYYVRVHSNADGTGQGGFLICVTHVAPANDECDGAAALTVNGTSCVTTTSGTTINATETLTGCVGEADDDVWYSFTATSALHSIEVVGGTMTDPVIEVFSGSCGSLTSLGCADYGSDADETFASFDLVVGTTYFVRIYNYWSDGQGTFTLCVKAPENPCDIAGSIASCGATTSVVLEAGYGLFTEYPDFFWTDRGNEKMWSYTPSVTGTYVIDLTALTGGYYVDFFFRESNTCGPDNWTYIDDMNAVGLTATFDLVAGTEYFIMIDDEDIVQSSATFEIKLANGDPCNTEVSMTNASMQVNEAGSSFSISLAIINPSSSALNVDLNLISGDGARINGFSTTSVTIPIGAATANYTITLTDNAICDENANLVFELANVTGSASAILGTLVSTSVVVVDNETEYQTLVSTGFETTDPAYVMDISSTNPWSASTVNPISGARSFVSGPSASAGQNYFSTDLNRTYYAGMTSVWRFQINHFGNEPDNTTKWQVILSSDQKDLTSASLNGYAVGVNPLTPIAADLVTLWKITNGTFAPIYTSSVDWGTGNTTVGFEVVRDENGLWTLKYDADGGFDALITLGTGTDETFAFASNYGVRYYYASGNGQKLAIDDMSFVQKGCRETIYSVATGNSSASVWSNTTNGSAVTKNIGRLTSVIVQTTHNVTLDEPMVTNNLTINGGGTLTCASQELVLHGNLSVVGSLAALSNKITFKGDAAQSFTYPANLNVNNITVFNSLPVNSGAALTLGANLNLRGVLSAEKGKVDANNNLTLISNATVTGSIGEIKADADVVGTITAQRYLPTAFQNYVNLGSPITGLTLGDWNDDLVTTGFPGSDYPSYNFNNIYTYNEVLPGDRNVGWVGATAISNPLLTNKGYMVYMTGAANIIDATGAFQKGNVSVPLSVTSTATSGDGWNLLLNPYPSEVDWNQVVANSTGISTYYVYDSQTGAYKSYNGSTSTGTASRYIPMGQSFFVGTTTQGATLNYTEAMKTATNTMLERSAIRPNGFVFELARGQFKDELMLLTSSEATPNFDEAHDAYRLVGPVAEMHSLYSTSTDNEKLAIDVRASWTENTIPLYVNASTKGKYTLTVNALPISTDITCWIIKDLSTGVELPLEVGMKLLASFEGNFEGIRWIIEPRALVSFGSLQSDNYTSDNGVIDVVSTNDAWNYTLVNELGNTVTSGAGSSSNTSLAAGRYTVAFSSSTGCAAQQIEVLVGSGNMVSAEEVVAAQEAAMQTSTVVNMEMNSIQVGTMSGAWMIQWKDNYEGKVKMTVYNSVGQVIMTESLDGTTRTHIIPNGKFSQGSYIIALSQNDQALYSGSCLVIE